MDCADLEHFHHCRFAGQCWSFCSTPCTPNLKVLTAPRPSRNAGQRWSGNERLISGEGSERLAREGHTVLSKNVDSFSRFNQSQPHSHRELQAAGVGVGAQGQQRLEWPQGGLGTAVSEQGGVRVSKQPEAGILTQGPTL